jgi:hypothetical protein
VNFLKSLEVWRNIMYQMMQLKINGFWAILYVCQEIFPSSQQPPGCWGSPGATSHPSTRPATFCSPSDPLLAYTSNRSHVAEEKSYWRWKMA